MWNTTFHKDTDKDILVNVYQVCLANPRSLNQASIGTDKQSISNRYSWEELSPFRILDCSRD